ncbi:hypothetical protein MC885_003240 [Smutsia gigantea]|nr:hypothetical protein MC885_003240 [Smutsia gigantea]
MAALTLFIKTRESLTRAGGEPWGRLHFPGDLGPLASDGVLHSSELLQELLPPRQRAGSPGLGGGGICGLARHTGDLAGALGLRGQRAFPVGAGRPSEGSSAASWQCRLLARVGTLALRWVRRHTANSGVAPRAWAPQAQSQLPQHLGEDQGCTGGTAGPGPRDHFPGKGSLYPTPYAQHRRRGRAEAM